MQAIAALDAFLAARLRGEGAAWPSGVETGAALRRIRFHGIAAFLHDTAGLPETLSQALLRERALQAIREQSWCAVIVPLLDAFAEAGVRALLLKGARLAYSVYDEPQRRMRGDTDVLVPKARLGEARKVLAKAGFARDAGVGDGLRQEQWTSGEEFGQSHVIDLHWAITNSPAINRALFPECAFSRAVPLPALSESASGAGGVTTLLHIALNRAFHLTHGFTAEGRRVTGEARLGWAMDVRMLACELDPCDWDEAAESAIDAGAAPCLLTALLEARSKLAAAVPVSIVDRLRAVPERTWLVEYLEGGLRQRLPHDLRAADGLIERGQLIAAHLAPPEAALRTRFSDADAPLWRLQLRRIAHAVKRT
ncbi:MAG: nucleotidyltransferase family protein [Alteraurantiacibacter sp.]